MNSNVINLKKIAGRKYRVTIEQSYYAGSGSTQKRNTDPYLWQIVGRHGDVFLWAPDLLAVSTHKRGGIALRLSELPCTTVVQDGQDGITMTFATEHLDTVADLAKLRIRPVLSEERRTEMSARMQLIRSGQK